MYKSPVPIGGCPGRPPCECVSCLSIAFTTFLRAAWPEFAPLGDPTALAPAARQRAVYRHLLWVCVLLLLFRLWTCLCLLHHLYVLSKRPSGCDDSHGPRTPGLKLLDHPSVRGMVLHVTCSVCLTLLRRALAPGLDGMAMGERYGISQPLELAGWNLTSQSCAECEGGDTCCLALLARTYPPPCPVQVAGQLREYPIT